MIVIKIKTWKDYKQQFLNWVKEPRQHTCIEYVEYAETMAKTYVEQNIRETCISTGLTNDNDTIYGLVVAAQAAIIDASNNAVKLIKDCQPKI